VPQSVARPAATTAEDGVHDHVPPLAVISMGVPSCGSAEVIRPSRPVMAGRPSASIAHIAYTAGRPCSSTRCGVGVPENG